MSHRNLYKMDFLRVLGGGRWVPVKKIVSLGAVFGGSYGFSPYDEVLKKKRYLAALPDLSTHQKPVSCLSPGGCALLLLHEFGLGSQSVHVPPFSFSFQIDQVLTGELILPNSCRDDTFPPTIMVQWIMGVSPISVSFHLG